MKFRRKYDIDLEEVYSKHISGYSLPELSKIYKIPRTTLNRYLRKAGYKVYFNRYKGRVASWQRRQEIEEFVCPTAWRGALLENMEHKCYICGYSKIVEAHHIIAQSEGGRSTRENGILLCPNHHMEVHAGLLSQEDLKKLNKLALNKEITHNVKRTCEFETR